MKYQELISRKKAEYGKKFSSKQLSKKFIPYYESGERIKVKFSYGEVKTGTVGVTTGWIPVFILMLTKRSSGSSWVLSKKETIITKL